MSETEERGNDRKGLYRRRRGRKRRKRRRMRTRRRKRRVRDTRKRRIKRSGITGMERRGSSKEILIRKTEKKTVWTMRRRLRQRKRRRKIK